MNGFAGRTRGPSAGGSPLLRLGQCDLSPAAGVAPVLRNVSVTVHAGECVAVVGPSGSGKTTMLRTIAGLVPPAAGELVIDGGLAMRARNGRHDARIGLISQRHDLVEGLRVETNVMAGALGRWSTMRALRFLVRPTVEERLEAEAALAEVGLAGTGRRRTGSLSGGEQQRVAIARALVQAPALLLADEPVASLDPGTAVDVLTLLTGLARSRGMALIASLHQPDLAARFCDRVLAVSGGMLTERAPA